ncbi:hypothetical protein OS190_10405 [Sulfitobacter sp. F26204]|uniref:hypothetical protein n=1 Tax=Sulfitobacter sp. F26204 TaxID=2996014 RepID=UPI00225DF250|nr:hypothetical protein [Sulfitobacter sp. F26204]MCX7559979.1 hypothetical protein [Sulfitobacter sp. F26204]
MSKLDAALLAAHASGNTERLVALYSQAADEAESAEGAAFYLTQAYVFALEAGHADAPSLHQRLLDAGREEPLGLARAPRR